jgi:NADPH:quinone reductase-like Zn-dependent oxidoreductase
MTDMLAIVADGYATDALSRLRATRIPRPVPRRGEVLVKINAAPCNPADLLYLEGRYGIDRPLPATPGFEGAGVVVESGGGLLGRWLVGKRVACGGHDCSGTWAEYCVAPAQACLPLAKDLTFEQGAAALANPTTALALIDLAKRLGHRAFVQTAAAGQLGKMIAVAGREAGLEGVHIVRRADQAASLVELGAKHVLVSTEPSFSTDLAERAAAIGASVAFDAVAGELTGRVLAAMPAGSEIVVYGGLSGDPCGSIDPMVLAFGDKHVRGFEIAGYLQDLGLLRAYGLARKAQNHVRTGAFVTTVANRIPLVDAPAGLAAYVSRMSDGKILLAA